MTDVKSQVKDTKTCYNSVFTRVMNGKSRLPSVIRGILDPDVAVALLDGKKTVDVTFTPELFDDKGNYLIGYSKWQHGHVPSTSDSSWADGDVDTFLVDVSIDGDTGTHEIGFFIDGLATMVERVNRKANVKVQGSISKSTTRDDRYYLNVHNVITDKQKMVQIIESALGITFDLVATKGADQQLQSTMPE